MPTAALCESPGDPARSENPGMHEVLHAENREVLRLPAGVDDARPGWFAGWQIDAWRDARGTLRR